jgi:hypothetical protein
MNQICPKCHTNNHHDAVTCAKCGYRLAAVDQRVSTPRLCPSRKHPMDPAWEECPYCVVDSDPVRETPLFKEIPKSESKSVDDDITRMQEQSQSAPRRSTQFVPARGSSLPPPATGRRIVGMMVTYSWRPEGEVFAVYEGRNYLGHDPDCEVRLMADHTISGKHAAIFYRGQNFTITDEKSMNGTFVNGVEAPITGTFLKNYDEIKTGATAWRFIIIEPGAANGDSRRP